MVLGAIIMNPERLDSVIPLVTPDDFYYDRCSLIFQQLVTMSLSKIPIDLISLTARLGDEVPSSYVSGLLDGLHKNANITAALQRIRELSQLRKVVGQAQVVIDAAYTGNHDHTMNALSKMDVTEIRDRAARSIADRVREYVSVTSGYFPVTSCYAELQVVTNQDKTAVRMALLRMVKSGEVERHPQKDGYYRRVDTEVVPIDFKTASIQSLDLLFPLDLTDILQIYPKCIGVIGGEKDSGKTAFCLNFIKMNMATWDVHYASSEYAGTELALRLRAHEDISFDEWKFRAFERTRNFHDIIKPNSINVIDWMGGEFADAAYLVNKAMLSILEKLNKGMALIALQKDKGKQFARGAGYTLDYARFYITFSSPGTAKIEVAKTFKGMHSPVGKVRNYKLVGGWKFIPQDEWHDPECDQQYERSKRGWIK